MLCGGLLEMVDCFVGLSGHGSMQVKAPIVRAYAIIEEQKKNHERERKT